MIATGSRSGALLAFGLFAILVLPLGASADTFSTTTSPRQVGYFCDPYTESYVEGGYYMPLYSGNCTYMAGNTSSGAIDFRYGDVYQGVVGSSTVRTGYFLGLATTSVQMQNLPSDVKQGDPFFTAIYHVDSDSAYVYAFRNFFMSGSNPPPGTEYGFINWKWGVAPATTSPCTQNCFDNVLFLPGIEASRLYRPDYAGGTDKLWEPNIDSDVQDLFLNPSGDSARFDVYTKKNDIITELPNGTNIYKSFIAKMNDLKAQGMINDWEATPYDWRLSLDDILRYGNELPDGRIYYSGDLRATSTPFIIQELRHLAATSRTGKVTIVAHSNGGLVAKKLTEVLGSDASKLIDKMIFVAVPQAGTPVALAAGLHGYDQDHFLGLVTSKSTARTFASTSPMFYHLLPSANYFTYVDDPVITIDPAVTDWTFRYGSAIHSQERLHNFLVDTYGRVDSQTGDIDQPIQMSNSLLSNAETLHADLDNWTPPQGINLIQIAGWGVPKTVSGINYKKKGLWVKPEMNTTIDGDGTVVVPSALWTSTSAGAVDYWMNLRNYSINHPLQTGLGYFPFSHADILETEPILDFISDNLSSTTKPLDEYGYLSISAPPSNDTRLRFTLHSPLTLNLYDGEGHHTGVSTTTGEIEEQIPGTYYTEFGDVKYLFTDATSSLHIVMNGYATSTFTFEEEQLQGDSLVASSTWQDMPTTPQTVVTTDTAPDIASQPPLLIDKNGDGTTDYIIAPQLNGTAPLPKTPLTVAANNIEATLGGPLPSPTANLSGFVGGDTASTSVTGSPVCSTTATSTKRIGSSPITCTIGTLASDAYTFNFAAGTLSIIYRWDGFSNPLNQSLFRSGNTITVKFQLKNASGTPVQSASPPVWLTPQKAGPTSGPPLTTTSTPPATGVIYNWDSKKKQYTYSWSTKGLTAGYWYRAYAQLDDGKTYSVVVGLR